MIHGIWVDAIRAIKDEDDLVLTQLVDHLFQNANQFADTLVDDDYYCFPLDVAEEMVKVRMAQGLQFYYPVREGNDVSDMMIQAYSILTSSQYAQSIRRQLGREPFAIDNGLWDMFRKHSLLRTLEEEMAQMNLSDWQSKDKRERVYLRLSALVEELNDASLLCKEATKRLQAHSM
jgi:hypothetical protein